MKTEKLEQLKVLVAENEAKLARLLAISPRMKDSICVANMQRVIDAQRAEIAMLKGGAR